MVSAKVRWCRICFVSWDCHSIFANASRARCLNGVTYIQLRFGCFACTLPLVGSPWEVLSAGVSSRGRWCSVGAGFALSHGSVKIIVKAP